MKQNNNKYKNRNTAERSSVWNWKLLPLQLILAVLPLVLRLKIDRSGLSEYPWSNSDDLYLDIFLNGKMVFFIVLSAVLLCMLVYKLWNMDKQTRKESFYKFIPLLVYLACVVLSTIFSKNVTYSLTGSMDAKEPATVLLGYVVTVFYAYLVVESAEDIKGLVGAAIAGSACMALLGVLQAIGKDPLLLEGIQRLFAGNAYVDNYGLLRLTFPVGMAYGTLFNPNYVGTYVTIYAPLLLLGLIIYRPVWKKAVCGVTFLGLLVMLFASQSRTGLISIVAVAVVLVVFLGRKLWKRWYLIVPVVAAAGAVFLFVDARRDFLMVNRLKEMFVLRPSEDPVQGVDTTGNGVRVLYKDTEFKVMMPISSSGDFAYVAFEGEEQKEVSYNEDRTYGYFTLNNGDEIAIQTAQYENRHAFGLYINDRSFYFTNQIVLGNYKYINELGNLDECVIPANVFPGYEQAASGRGYSWGRTIPLLADNLIVGSGPDTFVLEFPQNDYVARYRSAFDWTLFTRPHNFYLQMGVQTGVLSLLAFLVFYAIYFVKSCKLYCFREYRKPEEWMGFALFLSSVGFMAAGLANDSLIVVTPVFYVLLGAGMAVNHKLCPKKTETKNEVEVKEGK